MYYQRKKEKTGRKRKRDLRDTKAHVSFSTRRENCLEANFFER